MNNPTIDSIQAEYEILYAIAFEDGLDRKTKRHLANLGETLRAHYSLKYVHNIQRRIERNFWNGLEANDGDQY